MAFGTAREVLKRLAGGRRRVDNKAVVTIDKC